MSDDLLFMMGKYEVRIPADRAYAENHLWLQLVEGQTDKYRIGFTAYSVRLLQDVYFLEWNVDSNTLVKSRQEVGEIESSKALSTLYAPCAGTICEFNEQLLDDPTAINTDCYNKGWLFIIETRASFYDAETYYQILDKGWEETQRHLKGQIN